ncbi:hypothetical protein NDU88_003634 [Pleurodeles waltl]|uniref:Uncharacterized protein n=1 Tax=Pleurodeles waltl TaxID=8319 RepID=A0AAV7T6P3_PLEWA|nr:hypothetical protein NDU88_003634 [Pleurodeles waltl]
MPRGPLWQAGRHLTLPSADTGRRRPSGPQADKKPQPCVIWGPDWESAGDRGLLRSPEYGRVRRQQACWVRGDLDCGCALSRLCVFACSLSWASGPAGVPHGCNAADWHYRLGPKRRNDANHPRPIIACLLHHVRTCQLLQAARPHGPFRLDYLEVRLAADFSKETSERRRAFLDLRPCRPSAGSEIQLIRTSQDVDHQKRSVKRLLRPEDPQMFLDGLQHQIQSMDTESSTQPLDLLGPLSGVASSASAPEDTGRPATDSHPRGRDLETLTKSYEVRGQVMQAVAMHTQIADREKSRSPLKPTLTPT